MLLGVIQETPLFEHRVMVPPGIEGTFSWIAPEGLCRVDSVVARVRSPLGRERDIPLLQLWAVRTPRTERSRLCRGNPCDGAARHDGLFPLAKAVWRAFPAESHGKTVTQHHLAKCARRSRCLHRLDTGNEMTTAGGVPKAWDPLSGRPLLKGRFSSPTRPTARRGSEASTTRYHHGGVLPGHGVLRAPQCPDSRRGGPRRSLISGGWRDPRGGGISRIPSYPTRRILRAGGKCRNHGRRERKHLHHWCRFAAGRRFH
jgi:hypothetical protein